MHKFSREIIFMRYSLPAIILRNITYLLNFVQNPVERCPRFGHDSKPPSRFLLVISRMWEGHLGNQTVIIVRALV